MSLLDDRHKRILKKVNLSNLPFKLKENDFRSFVSQTTTTFLKVFKLREEHDSLKWCFSTIKKGKVFLKIFEYNYLGKKMYKEELAKSLPEYSYKTIANIIDEGVERGYFIELNPRLQKVKDAKVKNLRPSEEVAAAFINWYIKVLSSFYDLIKSKKIKLKVELNPKSNI